MIDVGENVTVEQPTIALFKTLGYSFINCFNEVPGKTSTIGRSTGSDVVLVPRLRYALHKLNHGLDADVINRAIDDLTRDRSSLNPVNANREVYTMLKDGVKVNYRDSSGIMTTETVKVIDWEHPENNDFLLASQLWITGTMYKRRADLVVFVNGLPLVFIELKASHKKVEDAFTDNMRDYKDTIPQLFWYNAFIILSNGSQSRIGTISAPFEHYADWKKINVEGETGIISLDTMIRGTCEKSRLLDLIENFILYTDTGGALKKMFAKNHQYLGVNNAFNRVIKIKENRGKLGVFWHTQGSGKSYSMVFLSQKVLRKIPGNWTFLVVTDRQELDGQIYENFASAGAVTEIQVQAESREHLKKLLQEDHRNIFTLIQKFGTKEGETFPKLSDRSDIIVITDEAHRSQYDTLAMNMRKALPNAAFIAFTGTPLIVGEEKTKEVFGDYVSVYNFRQSVEDGATVPLYYENRVPELKIINPRLDDDIYDLIDSASLSEDQERKLERELARRYHIFTRDERLEAIAKDIVRHFMGRGRRDKAMVISIDRFTTVKLYDKVQKYWKTYIEDLTAKLDSIIGDERKKAEADIVYMKETDMAVVISSSQNEISDFREKGLDIAVHRKRMLSEDLEKKYKDPEDKFRIVFVCSMWITGFDVPSLSTIYLDKPMRNHTLMQTIARANRVFKDKTNGLIVDYANVFYDLQKALAIYGSGIGGEIDGGDMPVKDKQELVKETRKAIEETTAYCKSIGIDIDRIMAVKEFELIRLLDNSVESILVNEDTRKRFLAMIANIQKLYKAILPDSAASEFIIPLSFFNHLVERIRILSDTNINEVMGEIEKVLDRSIDAKGFIIDDTSGGRTKEPVDLSKVNFEKLKEKFKLGHKRQIVEALKWDVEATIKRMAMKNKSRLSYFERFQKMIEEYNSGSMNVEEFFDRLIKLVNELDEEEKRGVREQMTEEELAIFDLLTKPEIDMSEKERKEVKKVAHTLLDSLKDKLVIDWRKRQESRARVYVAIEETLDLLPRVYTPDIYKQKVDRVYQHVYDSYYGEGKSIYVNV